jgi:hypothetical protein
VGLRVQIVAIEGKSPEAVHADCGLVPASDQTARPRLFGKIGSAGQYVLYLDQNVLPNAAMLKVLSRGATVTCLYVNETSMFSIASGWRNGIERWVVEYDCMPSTKLYVSGNPPPMFVEIRDRLLAEQANGELGVDYVFDIPVKLFEACGGLWYSEDSDLEESLRWTPLEAREPLEERFPDPRYARSTQSRRSVAHALIGPAFGAGALLMAVGLLYVQERQGSQGWPAFLVGLLIATMSSLAWFLTSRSRKG